MPDPAAGDELAPCQSCAATIHYCISQQRTGHGHCCERCNHAPPTSAATPKPIKCGQCQQPMTVDEFFSDDHPCLTEPEKTIDEAMSQWNL